MRMLCNYGPLKNGQRPKIINEKYDYYIVKTRGKLINVPKPFIGNYYDDDENK